MKNSFHSLLCTIVFVFIVQGLSAQSTLKFLEAAWETAEECTACATCEDATTDVKKVRKNITFHCDEEEIGTWYIIKAHLISCNTVRFFTGNTLGQNVGDSNFTDEKMALADMYREVKKHCKATDIERAASPHTDYALNIIQDFMSPYPGDDSPIFKVVEQMPRFPGCEDLETKKEKEQCALTELLAFIYSELNYPEEARTENVEGTVVIRFIVEKDGTLTDAHITRDIGSGCGEEALRIVESMNDLAGTWTPGHQRGEMVRVQYNLPVKFKLD